MPERGRLRSDDEDRVRRNIIFLKENIDGTHFVDLFFQRGIITHEEKTSISQLDTRERRTALFLDRLLFSGPGIAYGCFIEILRQQYTSVAKTLEENTNTDPYYSWFSNDNLTAAKKDYSLTPSDACKLAQCFYDDWPIIFMNLNFSSCKIEQEYVRNQDRRPQIINLLKGIKLGKLVNVLINLEDNKSALFNWQQLQDFVIKLKIE